MGDIHGEFDKLINFIKDKQYDGNVIIAGDCGVGFHNWEPDVHRLNSVCNKTNAHVYFVRGNHDNPFFFRGEYTLSNITLVDDYRLFQWGDEYVLTIGGAYSIDRRPRIYEDKNNAIRFAEGRLKTLQETYWVDEAFVYLPEVIDEIFQNYNVQYVVTHSAPLDCFPMGIESDIVRSYCKTDENLRTDLIHERTTLRNMRIQIAEKKDIKCWCYGHFHMSKVSEMYGTKFVALNCEEIYEIKNNYEEIAG
jgi:UDP-2,3-diacylglucosamine pyrophosphatase LpxH